MLLAEALVTPIKATRVRVEVYNKSLEKCVFSYSQSLTYNWLRRLYLSVQLP